MTHNIQDFAEYFNLYYENLTQYVYAFIKDEEVAKDIVQDVFINIYEQKEKIDKQRSIKSYFYTIAKNQALNYLKHQKVVHNNEQKLLWEKDFELENYEEYEQTLTQVRKVFDTLSPQQQQIINKCCIDGKSYQETADELQISINTVKTHLTRAIKHLRNTLKTKTILLLITQIITENRKTIEKNSLSVSPDSAPSLYYYKSMTDAKYNKRHRNSPTTTIPPKKNQ